MPSKDLNRVAARKAGLKCYGASAPCIHGHAPIRFTCNGRCIECDAMRRAEYMAANPGLEARWARERRAKDPGPHRAEAMRWYKKNRARAIVQMRASAKARGHQYYRDYSQRWRTANLEHVRAYNAEKSRLRRGLKGNPNGGSYTPDDINSIRERQDCRCAACGRGDIKLEVDHILAITKGGTNDPANIQLLCGSCNKSKHNHDFWEWMARKFGSPLSS